jgi:drug/metabolite transporter (DMT)-like permease
LGFFLFFKGLQSGTGTEASFLNGASALFALIVAHYWLRERITKLQYVGAAVMFFGLYIFTTLFSLEISSASIYFIASAFCWGSMQVVAKRLSKNVSMLIVAFFRMFVGALFLLPFVYGSFAGLFIPFTDSLLIFFFGFVFAISLVAFYFALNYLKASEASFVVLPAPFVTALLGYFFLGEMLVVLQWFGGLLMLIGMYFVLPKK